MSSRNRFMSRSEREKRAKSSPYSVDINKLFGGIPQRAKDAVLGAAQMIPYGPAGMITGAGMGVAAGEVNRRTGMVKLGDAEPPAPKPATEPAPAVEQSRISRDVTRGGATGTQTGPSPVKFDGTEGMDAFIKKLQGDDYGIRFSGQDTRTPMESSSLPTREEALKAGARMGGMNEKDMAYFMAGANMAPVELGSRTADSKGNTLDQITEPRSGEQTRSTLGASLSDKEGMRSYMSRVIKEGRENPSDEGPMAYATDGLDARSRAFLDYDGKGGSLMALRAADAAQGTLYAGGKLYDVSGKNKDGRYSVVNDQGREFLRNNRNESTTGEAYKEDFMKRVNKPEEAANPDEVVPTFSSKADYQQLSQRNLDGTVLMGEDDNATSFDRGINRSIITGAPSDVNMDNTRYFADPRAGEPARRGFLPTEEEAESYRGYYR